MKQTAKYNWKSFVLKLCQLNWWSIQVLMVWGLPCLFFSGKSAVSHATFKDSHVVHAT